MSWWMWMALGVVLAAFELASPGGFVVIFFAVAAVVVALLDLLGIARNPVLQWILFSALAIVALRLFRNPLLERLRSAERPVAVDSLAGETAIASTDMAPGQYGQAELRGSVWQARNVDLGPLRAGQRLRVVAVDGLMLDVRSE
jgi:membrane protein implicated in regulation of membrane protease activity